MNKRFYAQVVKEIIAAELEIFKQVFFNEFLDLTIWVILTISVMGYIMPYFGLKADFGPFQFGGVIAATGLFVLYGNIITFLQDLEGENVINYYLTLPIPSYLALVSKALYYFITYLILSLCMLPIGKMTLWNQLDIYHIAYFKLMLALIFQSIFYACFVIWTTSIVKNMANIGSVWARFIFPMWFLGGFQFSWVALYKATPLIAYINLLNPMIYITEATRTALLGQSDYINFWICLCAIVLFSALALFFGIRNFKKRLDFV